MTYAYLNRKVILVGTVVYTKLFNICDIIDHREFNLDYFNAIKKRRIYKIRKNPTRIFRNLVRKFKLKKIFAPFRPRFLPSHEKLIECRSTRIPYIYIYIFSSVPATNEKRLMAPGAAVRRNINKYETIDQKYGV